LYKIFAVVLLWVVVCGYIKVIYLFIRLTVGGSMGRICIIVLSLVEEAEERSLKEIESEIREELRQSLHLIPWSKEIKELKVLQEC